MLDGSGWVVVDSSGQITPAALPLRWPMEGWAAQGVPGGFLLVVDTGEPDYQIDVYWVGLDGSASFRSRLGTSLTRGLAASRIGDMIWFAYQAEQGGESGIAAVRTDLQGTVIDRFFLPQLVLESIAGAGDRGLLSTRELLGDGVGLIRLDASGVTADAPVTGYAGTAFGFAGLGYLVGPDWLDLDGNHVATIVRREVLTGATATSIRALWHQETFTAEGVDSWITATEIPFGSTDGAVTPLPTAHMATQTVLVDCLE